MNKFFSLISLVLIFSVSLSGCTSLAPKEVDLTTQTVSGEDALEVDENGNVTDVNKEKSSSQKSNKTFSEKSSKDAKNKNKSTAASKTDGGNDNSIFSVTASKNYIVNITKYSPKPVLSEITDASSNIKLPYQLYLPKDNGKKHPVLLLMHGAGERGNDNVLQMSNFKKLFSVAGDIVEDAIIIAPQCAETSWWNLGFDGIDTLDVVMNLLNNIIKKYNGDSNRIYITGLSMGGMATWDLIIAYNTYFTAAVPVCGSGDSNRAAKLKNMPIWIYHGTDDDTVAFKYSNRFYNSIVETGGKLVRFSQLEGVKHNAWDYAYTDRKMFSWLFAQNKAKNKSMDIPDNPVFKIVTNSGQTLIADSSISSFSTFLSDKEVYSLNLVLTDDGLKKLTSNYDKASDKNCKMYFGNEVLCEFNLSKKPNSKELNFIGVFKNSDIKNSFSTILRNVIYRQDCANIIEPK